MARTKQTARKEPASHLKIDKTVEVASVTIINRSSSETVYFSSEDNITCDCEIVGNTDSDNDNNNNDNDSDSGALEYLYFEVEPGASHVATLRVSHQDAEMGTSVVVVKSITFELQDRPLVAFETNEPPGVASRIQVTDGQTLVVIDNHQNPRLTSEQLFAIYQEIQTFRETKLEHVDTIWRQLAQEYQRPSPDALKRLYELQTMNQQFRRPSWYEDYRPLELVEVENKDALERQLKNNPFTLHAYWRALDREPGGNAAYFAIRYIFQLYPDNNNNKVTMEIFRNWDGENTYDGPIVPTSVQSLEGLHGKILEFILQQDTANATYNIVDLLSMDRESSNTEWSSVELIAFTQEAFDPQQADASVKQNAKTLLMASNRLLDEPDQKRARLQYDSMARVMSFVSPPQQSPIFRLHQEALYGPQFRNRSAHHEDMPVEGLPPQLQFIQFMTELVGMGRVCQLDCDGFLDELDGETHFEESRAANEIAAMNAAKTKELGPGYEFPILFRW